MSYKSPIDIIMSEMQLKLEDEVCKAVQNAGIVVDKDELLRALAYDRGQYQKGYNDREFELVRCKDCINRGNHNICPVFSPKNDFYCGYGKHMEGR